MLPSLLPLFPLPNVVLFPNVFLPLHVFEPRYRQMVRDALAGDRMIGMVLLQPGYEEDYERSPAIFEVGCAGLITLEERLADGRFNIVLQGLERFRIVGEEPPSSSTLYRRALIAPLTDDAKGGDALRAERRRLETVLTPILGGQLAERGLPPFMPDDDLVNALCQHLEFEAIERQALLECPGPLTRCRALIELLEMKALSGGPGGHIH